MKKEEIFLSDWQRILIGNAPLEFMLEVFLRTVVIYLALLIVLRLLGKRMNAQLTITEVAVMLTLGAIVAVPMQVPERGLLQGIVILICALVFQRDLNLLAVKFRKVELVTQGDVALIICDGALQLNEMVKSQISKEQLFGALRSQHIRHLGQVKRAYFEACGLVSVFQYPEPRPGLSVLPEKDKELHEAEVHDDKFCACLQCGNIVPKEEANRTNCPRCGCDTWTYAVKDKDLQEAEMQLQE